jgi:fatty-acyl-CoA synthase
VFVIDAQEDARASDRIHTHPRGALNFNETLEQGRALKRLEENFASAVDIALILYTSGSSAKPKPVPLQHFGCVENAFQIGERQALTPADRGWLTLPLCWSYGSVITFMSLMTHGACAILQEGFEPAEALDLIEKHRCTGYYGQANLLHALIEHPEFSPARTASLRTGLTTGTPDDIRLTAEVLGAQEVCTIYGLTEVYGNCVVSHCTDPLEWRQHGQGLPLPGVTMRVVDPDTGRDVPPGEVGEFWVRGYVMPGYLDEPEQNKLAFSDDGFFKTGDLGTIDARGHVHFHGRLKEVIKTGGINVSPLEVEDILQGCEGVAHACVVGVPHAIKGELVAALVRPIPGSAPTVEALRAHCRSKLASYKVPEIIRLVEDLPVTDTGKLSRKRALAQLQTELGHGG